MLASHQSLLHIRQACVQFVVQIDLKICFTNFHLGVRIYLRSPQDNFQNATCAVDRVNETGIKTQRHLFSLNLFVFSDQDVF